MEKPSTTWWIILGALGAVVLFGIVAVVAAPRVIGPRGFCDEATGIRLQVLGAFQEGDTPEADGEALQEVARETAPDLTSRADRVYWPGVGDDADAVAEAWEDAADADSVEEASDAAREFYALDDEFQDAHCGGAPTQEDFEGLDG
jgi:hypothetical protein